MNRKVDHTDIFIELEKKPERNVDYWWEKYDPTQRIIPLPYYLILKRGFDLLILLCASPVLIPVFLLCILLIRLDSKGSTIFTQNRTGQNGTPFKMYKFRTMVINAEELKKDLMHLNELQPPDFKISNDPRITRIGKFLRKTSLDELPQLLNILFNQMSFVGPRPTSFAAETYELWHTVRLDVPPGLTGIWQVVGRAATEFDQRVDLDAAYIKHRCFWLDFEILLRTVTAVLKQKGAH